MSNLNWQIRAALTRLYRSKTAARNRMMAKRAKPSITLEKFKHHPDPRSIGSFEVGQELLLGKFIFAGKKVEGSVQSIWSISAPSNGFTQEMQGFNWLDDLAAVGDKAARQMAQDWVRGWIRYYGDGTGEGWTPALTGRRILRICAHGRFLFGGLTQDHQVDILRSVARQITYLEKSWPLETSGNATLEALTGLIFAGVAFADRERSLALANKAIGAETARFIDETGSIETRNPEELMEAFTLLTWVCRTLEDVDVKPDPRIHTAIENIAPTMRSLRIGDGSLTRFHGGGRGPEGRLDQVLSDSRIRGVRTGELAMGYDRMTAGRVTLLTDCASPPSFEVSQHGHASTLAFEMSSGRLPILVNCGAGQKFGLEWERVCRATGAHNTIGLGAVSSAQIAPENFVSRTFGERLSNSPKHVKHAREQGLHGSLLVASHDGYVKGFNLIHQRRITLSIDGREIQGGDVFFANEKREVENAAKSFTAHFHLHPDVKPVMSKDETKIAMRLDNQEVWEFTLNGAKFSLEDSVYLDQRNLKPRATKQIVASGAIVEYAGQITWMFKRVQDAERPKIAPRQTP